MNPDTPSAPCSPWSRRSFLRRVTASSVVAAGAVGATVSHTEEKPAQAVATDPAPGGSLIDTNVYLGRWPFRRTVLDDGAALREKLRQHGVAEAWAGHFDALLHKDIRSVNDRLVETCRSLDADLFRPVGSIHPGLPGWRAELLRCVETHGMRAIRLHPNYHGYTLADPVAKDLLQLAAEHQLLVQIPLILEDERTIHPLMPVAPVDPAPLSGLMGDIPGLRVQLLNAFRTLRGLPLHSLAKQGLSFDIAMLEGMEGIANLTRQIPASQVCFGSYAPNFYFESALLKLKESVLSPETDAAVRSDNARALLT